MPSQVSLNEYEDWLINQLDNGLSRVFDHKISTEDLEEVLKQKAFTEIYHHEPTINREVRKATQLGLLVRLPNIDSDVELRVHQKEQDYHVDYPGQMFRYDLGITKEIQLIIPGWDEDILPLESDIFEMLMEANQKLQNEKYCVVEF